MRLQQLCLRRTQVMTALTVPCSDVHHCKVGPKQRPDVNERPDVLSITFGKSDLDAVLGRCIREAT